MTDLYNDVFIAIKWIHHKIFLNNVLSEKNVENVTVKL